MSVIVGIRRRWFRLWRVVDRISSGAETVRYLCWYQATMIDGTIVERP